MLGKDEKYGPILPAENGAPLILGYELNHESYSKSRFCVFLQSSHL